MHDRLLEQISHWNNQFLLEQYITHREQYTEAAFAVLEKEIARRRISVQEQNAVAASLNSETDVGAPADTPLKRDECVALTHPLRFNDTAIAAHLLQEAQIPFLLTPVADSAGKTKMVNLLVRPQQKERAEETLAPHFMVINGALQIHYDDIRQRLKSFDPASAGAGVLHDAGLELTLTAAECAAIIPFGRRLLDEVDAVEQTQERVVFYYDNIKAVLEKMDSRGNVSLNAADGLTILEILQIYGDDPALPESLWEVAGALLDCVGEITS